jgi:hypothetical protein
VTELMQRSAVPVDRLEIGLRRRDLYVVLRRHVEGPAAADAEIDAAGFEILVTACGRSAFTARRSTSPPSLPANPSVSRKSKTAFGWSDTGPVPSDKGFEHLTMKPRWQEAVVVPLAVRELRKS